MFKPLMATYLRDLQDRLTRKGLDCPLLMVMSTGGLTTVEAANGWWNPGRPAVPFSRVKSHVAADSTG